MKNGSLLFVVIFLLVLAGCGEEQAPQGEPTPVREPTLTFEERIQHPFGTAENPLQMVIRPTATVAAQIFVVLAYETETELADITPDTSLRDDLGLGEQLDEINPALARDFAVTVDRWDAESVLTVADLIHYVHIQLGKQVSAALFQRTGLYIDIVLVETYGEALTHLCSSAGGVVSISWVDGITYTAAIARECGEPAMQVAVADWHEPEFEEIVFPEKTPEPTPEVTVEATMEMTPEVTLEVKPDVGEISPTETPGPTDTPTPEPTATPTPEPTETAEITPEATVEITPEPTVNLSTGEAGVIIVHQEWEFSGSRAVVGRMFCRLGYDDFYSWLLPSLVMAQYDIDLQYDPMGIIDYADVPSLIQAVADGDCAATGVSQLTLDSLGEIAGVVVAETTVEFPHGVLVYPLEVGLGVRLTLVEHLPALAADPQDSRPLRLLLGQDAILLVEEGDFAILDAFMETTGYDFAQLGD